MDNYTNPQMLVETEWLKAHLHDSGIRILDARRAEKYSASHIPGALNIPIAGGYYLKDINDPRFVMPLDQFKALFESLGVSDDIQIIAYDDDGGHQAARIWWVMEYYGHPGSVRLLNGGWNKWIQEKLPATTELPSFPKGRLSLKENPRLRVPAEEILQARRQIILDVRSPEEYAGTDQRPNKRHGHIPGAVNIEWSRAVTSDDLKTFRPASELNRMYEKVGVAPNKTTITYCQGGVRAAHTLFTLRLIGYDKVRLYDGSWAEWGNRDDLPINK